MPQPVRIFSVPHRLALSLSRPATSARFTAIATNANCLSPRTTRVVRATGAMSGVEPSVWLTILTHIAFSVPIVVEAVASTYESVGPERLEDVARTLGASPYVVAETVTLPLIKRGVVAGAVLAFAHSLGETGATFLVMGRDVTVPVLVVNMVESLALPAAMFTSAYLTALSVLMFAVVRLTSR